MPSRSTSSLVLGGAVALTVATAVVPTPEGLTPAGQYALATMVFAGILWVTGALPLPATALLVPVWLTVFGVYPAIVGPLAAFADPIIFLLLAGFALAEALQAHDLDRRFAYYVVSRLGSSPRRLIGAVMLVTAVLSMVISNTATTALMVPIAVGVVGEVTGRTEPPSAADSPSNLHRAMLLGTAYAATVGGVGTLVGTPPNAIVVGQLRTLLGYSITFVDWLAIGLPLVAVSLPLVWYLLTFVIYPPGDHDVTVARERARTRLAESGPLSPGGKRALTVFAATALLWILGGLGFIFEGMLPPVVQTTLFGGPGPHLFGSGPHQGVLYFVVVGLLAIPALVVAGAAEFDDLLDIDWGTLVLFGGGLSLAAALADTGAIEWLADLLFGALTSVPLVVLLLAVVATTVLLGELASNTAMAAVLAPLLISAGARYAPMLGTSATLGSVFLALAGAIAASFGFALPVATPPNAIAFGTGWVRREDMLRAGVVLDVVMVLFVSGALSLAFRYVWPWLLR
ncbi:SLC13 family permease [Haloarculaceae archaeon H-GB2-1]|nr:SLC13 family permease [Haloarculaceae archaeon H-GB1-1]MEA5407181.1 SLC13 family permease [Haloarculaceae archaeon H-GB2-1]